MTSQPETPKGPCGICGGLPPEHEREDCAHVWVPEGGELLSKAEAAKRTKQPQSYVVRPPLAGDTGVVNRLVEVLLDKGILSTGEGLYIAGVGRKPPQYRDPAV